MGLYYLCYEVNKVKQRINIAVDCILQVSRAIATWKKWQIRQLQTTAFLSRVLSRSLMPGSAQRFLQKYRKGWVREQNQPEKTQRVRGKKVGKGKEERVGVRTKEKAAPGACAPPHAGSASHRGVLASGDHRARLLSWLYKTHVLRQKNQCSAESWNLSLLLKIFLLFVLFWWTRHPHPHQTKFH